MNYRQIWQQTNGPIPVDQHGRSYEIHHLDGNRSNNELSNLTCISIEEHYRIHERQGDGAACHAIRVRMHNDAQTGWKHSQEAREKMSKAKLGTTRQPHTDETKEKMSKAKKGKKLSEDSKRRLVESKRANGSLNHSEEAKQKMSEAKKGKVTWNNGKKASPETKLKMSEMRRGVPKGPQVRVECPHCGIVGGNAMKRWHFNNCKKYLENQIKLLTFKYDELNQIELLLNNNL